MSRIEQLRVALLDWARANGALASGVEVPNGGDRTEIPFPDEAGSFFTTRKIVRVIADEDNSQLLLFSRQKIALNKQEILEKSFNDAFADEKITLLVDFAKPYKVDLNTKTYGQFEPLHKSEMAYCCGSSVGLGNQRNAGTLTALARKKSDGKLVGICCNHVTGGCNTARPGTPVVIPGILDVSDEFQDITVIGYHERGAPMSQGVPSAVEIKGNRDFAYFEISDDALVSSLQGSGDEAYDTPIKFVKKVKKGMLVKKWGRSTRVTYGEIRSIIKSGEGVEYSLMSYYGAMNSQPFKGTIYYGEIYEIRSNTGPFSLGGDSGALLVTDEGGSEKVVGMIIGGDAQISIALPIREVLKEMGLELITGHNAIT